MIVRHFSQPYDWHAIDRELGTAGVAVARGFAAPELLDTLNAEADDYISAASSHQLGLPTTASDSYNSFLGHKTIRLHGLLEKFPNAGRLIGDQPLLDWADRALAEQSTSARLSAAEFIQIQPGEPRQPAHRDSDSWPLPVAEHPYIVNAIVALGEFTAANGATWVAPGSWQWSADRKHSAADFVQATMAAGDAVLFRGDLVHGAGANDSQLPRRAISISFCAGWLRSVENSALNLRPETVAALSPSLQKVLGYSAYDGSSRGTGLLGLYENGDPGVFLEATSEAKGRR